MNDVIAKDEVVIEDLIYEIRGKKLMLDSEYLQPNDMIIKERND